MGFTVAEITAVQAETWRVKAKVIGATTKWLPTLNSAGIAVIGETWLFLTPDLLAPLPNNAPAIGLGLVSNQL